MPGTEPTVIAGYHILSILGRGGMGTVYAARHPRLPRNDALKVLSPAYSADPDFRARFEREAHLAASLEHPNIVPVYDCGSDTESNRLWLSMRLVSGGTAHDRLAAAPQGLDPAEVIEICRPVARALDFAHSRRLLHRDVKPENILIDTSNDVPHILLSDFGIARVVGDTRLTGTGMIIGTVDYSSPEQLRGEPLDGQADQYSLACTAAHLLTTVKPFTGTAPSAVMLKHLAADRPSISANRAGLSPAVDPVFRRALDVDPARRYRSCSEFVGALEHAFFAAGPTSAFATNAEVVPTQLSPSHPWPMGSPPPPGHAPAPSLAGGTPRVDPHLEQTRVQTGPNQPAPQSPEQSSDISRRRTPYLVGAAALVVMLAGAGVAYGVLRTDDRNTPAAEATTMPTAQASGSVVADSDPAATAKGAPTRSVADSAPPTYNTVNSARRAIDPCSVPSDLLRTGGMQTPLSLRDTPAEQAIICGQTLAANSAQDVIIGGYVQGSTWEGTMLSNYGRAADSDLRGWRSYDMTETNGTAWCKYGYSSGGPAPYTLEIGTIRTPGPRQRGTYAPTVAGRDAACRQLRAIAEGIDPAMPHSR